jgi:hypothetical protein
MSAMEKAEAEAKAVMAELEAAMERTKFPPRKGIWCKVIGLSKNTDMNGKIAQVIREELDEDGTVGIDFSTDGTLKGQEHNIQPKNLAPIPGSERIGSFHRHIVFKVSGIASDEDKKALLGALTAITGVDEVAVRILSKVETGQDTNPVTIMGAFKDQEVTAAVEALDAGRSRYSVEETSSLTAR